jgi:hypothetical protein
LPKHAFPCEADDETETADCDEERINSGDLEVFQVLEHQVDDRVAAGIFRCGVAESASRLEAGADVGKADHIVRGRNTRKQGDRHQKDSHPPIEPRSESRDSSPLGKHRGAKRACGQQQPDQIESDDQLVMIIAVWTGSQATPARRAGAALPQGAGRSAALVRRSVRLLVSPS